MLTSLLVKLIKLKWGSILPELLRAAAEGKLGEPTKKVYWFAAGKKSATGAIIAAVAVGAMHTCGNYADFPWACKVAEGAMWAGALLTGLGLVDGGVRAPWPSGTPKGPDGAPKA